MVHARPFSFTDDSTNVALPSFLAGESWESSLKPPSNRKPLHDSIFLFKFRMLQSSWYQELFQSNRGPLVISSPYTWQMCQKMQGWAESLPKSLSTISKILFELDLSYSYVYCLAPSNRMKTISPYAKSLIYESSINYIHSIATICQDPSNYVFYTFHDALKVYFVGSQFTSVLGENQDYLLNITPPLNPPFDGCPQLLIIPRIGEQDKIEKSLLCIYQIKFTLETFGYRWDDCKVLLRSFEAQVENLVESLKLRKLAFSASSRI